MKTRPHYIPVTESQAGMVLGAPLNISGPNGIVRFSLPAGHTLTEDNLHQLVTHHGEYLLVLEPDNRSDEQVALDAMLAARRVMEIFQGASLDEPLMASLFDCVLTYRSL